MAAYPASVWDAISETREDPDVQRQPDGYDWRRLVGEIRAIQTQLLPLGIGAAGTIPASDPAVAGKLWADSGAVKVSAGT